MSRTARVAITVVVVEVGLALLWLYLARYGMQHPDTVTSDFQGRVGSVFGMAMGAILGVSVVLLLAARRKDRSAR
jgi:hypothetical protein